MALPMEVLLFFLRVLPLPRRGLPPPPLSSALSPTGERNPLRASLLLVLSILGELLRGRKVLPFSLLLAASCTAGRRVAEETRRSEADDEEAEAELDAVIVCDLVGHQEASCSALLAFSMK